MLRAWRAYATYDPERASIRTWLYRIATNACLNALESRERRPLPSGVGPVFDDPEAAFVPGLEVPWLQPLPADPAASAVERSQLRLAFVAALSCSRPGSGPRSSCAKCSTCPPRASQTFSARRPRASTAPCSEHGRARARWASTRTRRPSRRPSSAPSSTASSPRSSGLTSRSSPRCWPTTSCSRCRRCGTGTGAGTTSARSCGGCSGRGRGVADGTALGERGGGLRGVRVRRAPNRDDPHRGSRKGDTHDRVPGRDGVRSFRARPMNQRTLTGRYGWSAFRPTMNRRNRYGQGQGHRQRVRHAGRVVENPQGSEGAGGAGRSAPVPRPS